MIYRFKFKFFIKRKINFVIFCLNFNKFINIYRYYSFFHLIFIKFHLILFVIKFIYNSFNLLLLYLNFRIKKIKILFLFMGTFWYRFIYKLFFKTLFKILGINFLYFISNLQIKINLYNIIHNN